MQLVCVFKHALRISVFAFVTMLLVDFIDTASERRMTEIMKGGRGLSIPWHLFSVRLLVVYVLLLM